VLRLDNIKLGTCKQKTKIMRLGIYLFVLALFSANVLIGSEKPSESNTNSFNVLVVGFPEDNIFTYYTNNEVAKSCNVHKDSIYSQFYKTVCKNMVIEDQTFNMIVLDNPKKAKPFLSEINYTDKEINRGEFLKTIDLKELPQNYVANLSNTYRADYVLFVNYYEFNWKGDPYFSIEHKIHYQIISRDNKIVDSEILTFMTSELVNLDKLEKKLKKKFARQFSKQSELIVPLEHSFQARL
jgi:hypothetical protein